MLINTRTQEKYPATVPGSVHRDLENAGLLPPLWWRDNEALQQWVEPLIWSYERTFECPFAHDPVDLVCEGLDTIAEIWVNGRSVGRADNMFRTWRFDLSQTLNPGENRIVITFFPTLETIAKGQAKRPLREWNNYYEQHRGRGYVRKMACAYGWDWGPAIPTAGIWKSIRLESNSGPRFSDFHINQVHSRDMVELRVKWRASKAGLLKIQVRNPAHAIVAEMTVPSDKGSVGMEIPHPEFWWPNTLGAQALYTVEAQLADQHGAGEIITKKIGLRSLHLVRGKDKTGESFTFEVNGKPVFCKGANWVPHRIHPSETDAPEVRQLLKDAAFSNMNMIRVWGGGLYESDAFYDTCDELGLLVWQDFAFACGEYPTWDDAFLTSVEAEARDQIRRLRHHASLALWCGNNEMEMGFAGSSTYSWKEYGRLFDRLLADLCKELDPSTPYWPGSPHTPVGKREDSNDERSGDAHLWSVFFGHETFENQRKWRCRFMSEYGFQSFPELRTVESFTAPEDRSLTSRIMDYHQRSQMGNRTIYSYLLDWFQPGAGLRENLLLTQFTHALCVRYAAEHLRRIQPHCMGVLYWQINDIWPCASWSSIDAFGRWKTLQYEARRFFAPVLVSVEEDLQRATARIHLSNQGPGEFAGIVRWEVSDTDAWVLESGSQEVVLPSQSGRYMIELHAESPKRHPHDLMVWAWAESNGTVISRNWAPMARPKHLDLIQPAISWIISEDAIGTVIEVRSDHPACYVMLEVRDEDVWFDDNCFHLHPGEARMIRVMRGPDIEVIKQKLYIESLADLMPRRKRGTSLLDRLANYSPARKLD